MDAEHLGARIRARREAIGLSQQDVAVQMKIAQATVSKWENGDRDIGVADLLKLADALETTAADLLRDDDKPTPQRRSPGRPPTPANRPRGHPAVSETSAPQQRRMIGVGVIRGNEALNALVRVAKNDPYRKAGLKLIMNWIRTGTDPDYGDTGNVRLAWVDEALRCLKRIPKNDQLRQRGLQIVSDWIESNR